MLAVADEKWVIYLAWCNSHNYLLLCEGVLAVIRAYVDLACAIDADK